MSLSHTHIGNAAIYLSWVVGKFNLHWLISTNSIPQISRSHTAGIFLNALDYPKQYNLNLCYYYRTTSICCTYNIDIMFAYIILLVQTFSISYWTIENTNGTPFPTFNCISMGTIFSHVRKPLKHELNMYYNVHCRNAIVCHK